jgi:hypothetical protein
MAAARVLVLFPNAWDRVQLGKPKYRGAYEFTYEGDDFFKFPGTLKLVTFDACAYIDALAERFRGRIDGVLSTDEYVGAIIAARASSACRAAIRRASSRRSTSITPASPSVVWRSRGRPTWR